MLLKDNSSSVGLRNQKLLVQLQVAAMHVTSVALSSSLLMIFSLLFYPVITSLSPTPTNPDWAIKKVKTAVKLAFFVSLLPLFLFLDQGPETIVTA